MFIIRLLTLFLLITNHLKISGQTVVERPDNYLSIYDETGLLENKEYEAIRLKLDNYEIITRNELIVVIVKTLNNISIESYSEQVFNTWKLGKKDKNNGLLLLIAIDERKMRIETGYAFEERLNDAVCSSIITNILRPNFQKGLFYEGIEISTNYIIDKLNPEFESEKFAIRKIEKIAELNLNLKKSEVIKDSYNPWLIFLLTFAGQILTGLFLILLYRNQTNKSTQKNLQVAVLLISLAFAVFSLVLLNSSDFATSYSELNSIFLIFMILSILTYFFILLPKKVAEISSKIIYEIYRIAFCTAIGMFFTMIVCIAFTRSTSIFLTGSLILSSIFYYLILKNNISLMINSSVKNSGSYHSNNYNSDNYNSNTDSYSDSTYGGGSSGGGGASGSW